MLTGGTPYVVYPRRVSSATAPFSYGYQITSFAVAQCLHSRRHEIFATNNPKAVPSNTMMDVDRYQRDLAAVTESSTITPLNLSGIDPGIRQRQALHMDARPGAESRKFDRRCGVRRNRRAAPSAAMLTRTHIPERTAEFAKDTRSSIAREIWSVDLESRT